MALIARLVTACGCTRDQTISEEVPVFRVAIQDAFRWVSVYDLQAVQPAHSIREFELFRVITSGEGALARIVEYRERVEPVRPRAQAPPRIRVHQIQPNGQLVALNVVRVWPDLDRLTVEVAGGMAPEKDSRMAQDTPGAL